MDFTVHGMPIGVANASFRTADLPRPNDGWVRTGATRRSRTVGAAGNQCHLF
jgi:hypothetical protein